MKRFLSALRAPAAHLQRNSCPDFVRVSLCLSVICLLTLNTFAADVSAAYQFTVAGESLSDAERRQLPQQIVAAVSAGQNIRWSARDLSYSTGLEEVAGRVTGADLVVRGHVAYQGGRSDITLQYGLTRGENLLVLPPASRTVNTPAASEIPAAVAQAFRETWPVIVTRSNQPGWFDGGRETGLQTGDRLWPLESLPPARGPLAAALRDTAPVTVTQASQGTSRLSIAGSPQNSYVRIAGDPSAIAVSTRQWQTQIVDAGSQPITGGTLVLHDAAGWSTSLDLAANQGRVTAEVPVSVPLTAQLTTAAGATHTDSLLVDPLAPTEATWRWAAVMPADGQIALVAPPPPPPRVEALQAPTTASAASAPVAAVLTLSPTISRLRFTGVNGEQVTVRVANQLVRGDQTTPAIARTTDRFELLEGPPGVIMPFTYQMNLAGASDGSLITVPLYRDWSEVPPQALAAQQAAAPAAAPTPVSTNPQIATLRERYNPDELRIEGISNIFASADQTPAATAIDTEAFEFEIRRQLAEAINAGSAQLAAVRPQRDALRQSGYLPDMTNNLDQAEQRAADALAADDLTAAWRALQPSLTQIGQTRMNQWNTAQIQSVRAADTQLAQQMDVANGNAQDVSAALAAAAAAQREMVQGDWNEAEQVLTQANANLAAAPLSPPVRVEPVAQRDEPVSTDPDDWAHELFSVGEYAQAQTVFDQAVRQNPNNEEAWFGLGHAAFASGNYEEASNAIREGLNLDPAHPRDQLTREELYGNPADRNDQLGGVDNHLRRNGADPAALFTFGYHLYHDGRTRAAQEVLRQIPSSAPEYNAAQLYLEAIAEDE